MSRTLRPVFGAIQTVGLKIEDILIEEPPEQPHPFITIGRQAWAGGVTLAKRLADRLNHLEPHAPRAWKPYDRELVEKISADHKLSPSLIEALEDESRNWLRELLGDFLSSGPSDIAIFRRTAATIRAIARSGRVVVVGRGGVLITRGMPAGIHIYLVAPFEHRVRNLMRQADLSHDQASARVRELDQNRADFYRTFFPRHPFSLDLFDLVLNTASLNEDQLVQAIVPLVQNLKKKA